MLGRENPAPVDVYEGPMHIDRCYCFQATFAALKEVADTCGVGSISGLQEHLHFGHKCKLCHPYVRRMLRTGDVVFHEIVREQDEPETISS